MAFSHWMLLLACAATAPAAFAGDVLRCGDGRNVRYQDVPCAAGETTHRWQMPASGVPQTPQRTRAKTRAAPSTPLPRTRTKRGRRPAAGTLVLIPLQRDAEACRRTRIARAQALQRVQPRPGFLLQRQWDDSVRDACQ